MFQLVKSEVLPLTLEFAQEFKTMKGSPTERELKEQRVNVLREKALSGQLVNFYWVTAKLQDTKYRMNGQHSSTMLCDLENNFPKGLKVHYDEYCVDNREGLALLFRQFDSRTSSRSQADVSGAYQGLYDDLLIVPRDVAKLGIEGVIWWNRHVEGIPTPKGDDVYSMFGDERHHDYLRWLGDILSIKTPELKKQPIAAAMYATFNTRKSNAQEFWSNVARGGVDYTEGHPSTILDNWLKAAKEGETKKLVNILPGQLYQGCIYAWNAFRGDKTIKDIRYDIKKGLLPVSE